MSLFRWRRCWLAFCRTGLRVAGGGALIGILAPIARAQTEANPHQTAVAFSADVGPYPDAFTGHCGAAPNSQADGSAIGLGAGVSAIDRPRSMVFLEADLRASVYRGSACGELVTPGGLIDYSPMAGTPVMPLVRTLLHAGLETPASFPLMLRAAVGGGMIWNAHTAPVGSVTLGAGSNNPGARFFSELEWDVSRARMTVTREGFLPPGNTSVTTEVAHPAWMALRMGVEWPLH
jgi:hypothetical protein